MVLLDLGNPKAYFEEALTRLAMAQWWIVAALIGLLCIRVCWLATYRLFFHPLARYPGPFMSRLSEIPMIISALRCQATYRRHELHQRYGRTVRTGPNELSFADTASIKDIYGQTAEPCLKSANFYGGFTLTGTDSVFSATDRSIHARMRRLLSHGFSQQGVANFQTEIMNIIEGFLSKVSAASQPCNLYDLVQNLFMDTTSQLAFAKSFNLLDGEIHPCALDIETYFSVSPLFGIFPITKYLPFGLFEGAKRARPRIIKAVAAYVEDFRQRLERGTAQDGLLRLMLEAQDKETGTKFTNEELIENAVLFIIAGSGTTATTLLYLIYEVGKQPEVRARMVAEIREAFPDPAVFPALDRALTLPYLDCVLQEVLRLRGPIPTAAPRISPGKMIGGKYVPAGVTVSNLAYSTHRDPEVFPEPNKFLPERWIEPSTSMKRMHRPFSTGPRNCIGMHLARAQLMLTVAVLYQKFDVIVDSKTTDEMMVLHDQGTMSPTGKQLWATIQPRKISEDHSAFSLV